MKLGAMIYSFGPAIRSGEMPQRDVIKFCGELGLACVDTMHGMGGDDWADVRKWVEDAGMFVASHITSAPLTDPDDATWQEGIDKVKACVDDTVTLGSDKLMVVTGSIPEGGDRAAAQRRVGEAFAKIIDETRNANVQLCIEDFPGERSPHRTSDEMLAVAEAAGPELGFCYDTGNFYCGGETPEEAWPKVQPRTIHSHLKDWAWTADGRLSTPDGKHFTAELVGRGFLDYPAILAAMKASGYTGALSFEYEGPMNRAEAAREGLGYLQSVLDSI